MKWRNESGERICDLTDAVIRFSFLELWGLLMKHQPERMRASKRSSCAITRRSEWEKMDLFIKCISIVILLYVSHFSLSHTYTLFPDFHPHRVLGHYLQFPLHWVIAASQYPIITSSVFLSLSPPPLRRLYHELIPEHLVFSTSVRQWPSCMFFLILGGHQTSRGSNICSGETQLTARGSHSSLYLRVGEANQNESHSLSFTADTPTQRHTDKPEGTVALTQ